MIKTKVILSFALVLGCLHSKGQVVPRLMLPVGHTDFVNSAVFSPDGKWVCTASSDHTVKLWETISGKLIYNLTGHSGGVRSVCFSMDGKKILTASDDYTAKLWDVFSGKIVFNLKGHSDAVRSAVFSPDSKKILTASQDNTAKLWDAHGGELLLTLGGHKSDVNTAIFSADGSRILTASDDKTVKLWNTKNGDLLRNYKGHGSKVKSAVFSPDEKFILTASWDSTAVLWDAADGTQIHTLNEHKAEVSSAIFSPDGKMMLTISYDKTVKVCDVSTGKTVVNLNGHTDNVRFASFSPDGKKILTVSDDRTAKLWDAFSGRLIYSLNGHQSRINTGLFSPDGKKILTASRDQTAKLWDVAGGIKILDYDGHVESINAVHVSLDSKYILASSWDNTTRLWDINSGKMRHALKGNTACVHSAFSPDEKTVFTVSYDGKGRLWDAENGTQLITLEGKLEPVGPASFSPDGEMILALFDDFNVGIWSTRTGKVLHTLKKQDEKIRDANISSDGRMIVTAGEDGSLKLWNAQNGKALNAIKAHNSEITEALFSPDNKKIVTASGDGTAKIWDTENGKLLFSFEGHPKVISDVLFSPSGNRILTTSTDSTCALWNSDNGKLLYTFSGHLAQVYFVQFSPDGNYILTASEQKAILWDAKSGKELKTLNFEGECSHVDFAANKLLSHQNGMLTLWDLKSGLALFAWVAVDEVDYLVLLPDKYYMASNNAASKLHYVLNNLQTLSFEQLDIKYNRPDKIRSVLGEIMGNSDTLLCRSYLNAWLKRIQKSGIDTNAFQERFSLPESDFKNKQEIQFEQTENQLTLQVWGKDVNNKLDRYNVWVNEVPVFGERGISIRDKNLNEINTAVTIRLSEGDNKIETSVLNVNGIESYRIPLYVRYNPPRPTAEKLYFIGIGVDHYQEPGHDLKYSAKDIRDLSLALKEKYGQRISIDTLLNEKVTRENVTALKKKLLQSDVNDKVIISFSGHGLLDKNYDYFLTTHTVNFKNPSENGLPYEDLEWLLDSIPARKKLLLLDACHSGEVDKEELLAINNTEQREGVKGAELEYEYAPTLGMKNSFELMQELFTNVKRGTGATIISAAGGTQYAYEKGGLKNGVFTYSILELMQQQNEIKVSELKSKVGIRVYELTNGLQKPTSRNETIGNNWIVW